MPSPNFLLIGAAKAGTTSMQNYMNQHPDVFMARAKECHHFLFPAGEPNFVGPGDDAGFNRGVISGRDGYSRLFMHARGKRAIGESSVYYLYQPEAIRRSQEYRADMRYIALLREPGSRARSAFAHHRRDAREPCATLAAALAAEQSRIESGWAYGWHYAAAGDYVPQVSRILELVPREQVLFILYEDFARDPAIALRRAFAFLGVDPDFHVDTRIIYNASGLPRMKWLNRRLISDDSRGKKVVKSIMPRDVGIALKHRALRWNLSPADEKAHNPRLQYNTDTWRLRLRELTGLNISYWDEV